MTECGEGSLWVKCPECGHRIEDLWDFNLDDNRWEHVWCPSCDAMFSMFCAVSYDYEVRKIGEGPND